MDIKNAFQLSFESKGKSSNEDFQKRRCLKHATIFCYSWLHLIDFFLLLYVHQIDLIRILDMSVFDFNLFFFCLSFLKRLQTAQELLFIKNLFKLFWFENFVRFGIFLIMFMLVINYVMLHNTNPVTGWKCDKREVVWGVLKRRCLQQWVPCK